jgi:AraC-like DNA-binding protein
MDDVRSRWLAEAERYIADCHAGSACMRASELALRMNVTPARLAREFHATVGIRVKDYLIARQVERAQELLRTTARNTAQIAAAAGFGTTRSFFRAFRRSTGMSPTEYRQKMSLAETHFRP